MEMNIIMEDASSLRCAWCIITVCGETVSTFTVDRQAILQRGSGFLRDCLSGGMVPKPAGLPMWVKKIFTVFFSKHKERFFMLDKCFQKIKRHPMRSSGSHDTCRIKVMMAAFLARLYTIVNL